MTARKAPTTRRKAASTSPVRHAQKLRAIASAAGCEPATLTGREIPECFRLMWRDFSRDERAMLWVAALAALRLRLGGVR